MGLARDCGPEVARRLVDFTTFEGVEVTADERYFRVDVDACEVRAGALTALEQQLLAGWRWFAPDELAGLDEAFFPADLAELVRATAPR